MCTEDRLLSQMESYLDEMVDCFEAFVKKSMLVVSVAVGTLVLMVMYVLKLMSERTNRQITEDMAIGTEHFNSSCQVRPQQLAEIIPRASNPCKEKKSFINEFLPVGNTRTISLQVIPSTYPTYGASRDETFLNEIDLGFTSKSLDTCKQTQVSEDLKSARTDSNFMRTMQSCVSKNHLSPSRPCYKGSAMNLERNSCCSMCCEDDVCNQK
ncbi:hypothetical protein PYW08_016678 [Mythimna loreyi]|uniref:Uncharacterized protein n=1 Tax=Mythimna loreyi TaxID=667449 RepID=A0ACC2QXN3_9NEOP|nr:hypothetical protein PYW08_016678 [Mythimna loreyi]